jgi:tetratricopeptide (TPR) repeat protein
VGIAPQLAEPRAAQRSLIDFPGAVQARNEYEGALRNHTRHYARLLQREGGELLGLGATAANQPLAMQQLRVDQRNLLRALDYALDLHDQPLLLSLAEHLGLPLELRGEFRLMGEQYAALLTEAQCLKDEPLELQARLGLARVALSLSKPDEALREAEAAEGLADALDHHLGLLRSRLTQADVWWMRCEKPKARAAYETALALARELDVIADICRCLCELAGCAQDEVDFPRAAELLAECQSLAGQHGLDGHLAAACRIEGNVLFEQGRLNEAHAANCRALRLSEQIDDQQGVGVGLRGLAGVAYYRQDYAEARRLLEESLAILHERGDRYGYAMTLNNLASVLGQLGDHARAAEVGLQTASIAAELGDRHGEAIALANLGIVNLKLDRVAEATDNLRTALASFGEAGSKAGQLIAVGWLAAALAHAAKYHPAAVLLAGAKSHIADIPDSHAKSCQGGLDLTEQLLAAAVESAAVNSGELATQQQLGEALDFAETVRYARHATR